MANCSEVAIKVIGISGKKKMRGESELKRENVAVFLIVLFLVATFGYLLWSLRTQYLELHSMYGVLQTDYDKLSEKYASLEEEISLLKDEHRALQREHSSLNEQHTKLELDYRHLQSEHDKLVSEYNSLQTEYGKLSEQYEAIYDSRYEEGYDAGYIQGVTDGAGRGYNIRDPTYLEALQFVSTDQTDKNQYVEEEYTCVNFAADFKNNAFKAEYRCGLVYIEFPKSAHTIVCFNTTDQGLILIEPQDDELVTLTIGQPYFDRTKYEVTFDDTVIMFIIIW